jgi:GNAT superfamily N-acetyltransferase
VDVRQESPAVLAEYSEIPIAFEVTAVFDVAPEPDKADRFALTPRRLAAPYVKDYDAAGEHPTEWAKRSDVSAWGFFSAFVNEERVGRVTVARDVALDWLEQADIAVLWDIRVHPAWRGRGVGTAMKCSSCGTRISPHDDFDILFLLP